MRTDMMKGYGDIVIIVFLLLLIIAMYQLSGDAKVLGGRAKRSTYFSQTEGNDERNRKKP